MLIRPATVADADALAAIYGHHVLHSVGTFEEVAPSPAEMDQRRRAVEAHGLPWRVAEEAGRLLGFAFAAPFRPRAAYRHTVEDSVYVAPDAMGCGVGRGVLSDILAACETLGLRQVIAVIGGSDNTASIGLHRALGFAPAGVGKSLGFKHGRWIDVVWMQKPLGGGDSCGPDAPGLTLTGR